MQCVPRRVIDWGTQKLRMGHDFVYIRGTECDGWDALKTI